MRPLSPMFNPYEASFMDEVPLVEILAAATSAVDVTLERAEVVTDDHWAASSSTPSSIP